MHKDIALLNWVVEVKQQLGESCKNGVIVPLVCMFFNEVSSPDVVQRKKDLMEGLESIDRSAQQQPNCFFRVCYSVSAWYQRLKLRVRLMAVKPPASLVAACVSQPEFDFLQLVLLLSFRNCDPNVSAGGFTYLANDARPGENGTAKISTPTTYPNIFLRCRATRIHRFPLFLVVLKLWTCWRAFSLAKCIAR